jgi:hypothetical protein
VQVVLRRRSLRRPRDLVAHPPPAAVEGGGAAGSPPARGFLLREGGDCGRVAWGGGDRVSGGGIGWKEGCLEVCRVGEPNPPCVLCPPG